jgi:LPS-assembly protein
MSPRILSKRGLLLGNEFRYLNRNWSGELNMEYLSNDKLFGDDRYFAAWRHRQALMQSLI